MDLSGGFLTLIWERALQKNAREWRGGLDYIEKIRRQEGSVHQSDGRDSITGTGSGWKNVEAAN